ncbi:OsmC family protein [Polaribacter sp. SA4-12]|uniref:OsmC family protein n=1 Tax=Polaribacter sp. SA4-12 TaxID=1312072 RepID=UPI000B3CBAD9|nr:OsmC family protein [Polaribacter sp. SA4-12]ARV16297.1 osmotically inducible protein OsmC [Polaribacter sp. SA4-12]
MATNLVTTTWKENMQFESDNPSGISLTMDAGEESGGEGKGYRPKALMLSSLAGCSGLDVVSLLKKMHAEVAEFRIDVTAELTDEHPKFYNKVKVDYHFSDSELQPKKIQKAVNLSVTKYCGVMEMFRQFAEVEIEIFLHEL